MSSLKSRPRAVVELGEASESDDNENDLDSFSTIPLTVRAPPPATGSVPQNASTTYAGTGDDASRLVTATAANDPHGADQRARHTQTTQSPHPSETYSLPAVSGSTTSLCQELPVRPMSCRSLVDANCRLAKGIRETATLPYALAIKQIDDVALDLARGQQLMDDVYHVLESVGASLQAIECQADEMRAHCLATLPVAPSLQGFHIPKGPG